MKLWAVCDYWDDTGPINSFSIAKVLNSEEKASRWANKHRPDGRPGGRFPGWTIVKPVEEETTMEELRE